MVCAGLFLHLPGASIKPCLLSWSLEVGAFDDTTFAVNIFDSYICFYMR